MTGSGIYNVSKAVGKQVIIRSITECPGPKGQQDELHHLKHRFHVQAVARFTLAIES